MDRLRARKHRPHKPFAMMARDLDVLQRYAIVSADARAVLESPAAPIALLPAAGAQSVASGVAPGQRRLGVMLPTTVEATS